MLSRAAFLACLLLFSSLQARSDAQPSNSPATALDEVLVTGERPGPRMWRVSKNGHDLWILATLHPLPKNMTWRSQEVEQRVASSQQVLSVPDIDFKVGFFRALTLIPAAMSARKSPDGRSLEQILPHDLYIRWLALRVKYLGTYDEHRRPLLAALDLYGSALEQSGLTGSGFVWDTVEKTAKKSHVPIQSTLLEIKLDDAKGVVRDFGKIPQDAEIACFAKTLERLEVDLKPMVKRANFWALGDMEGLRSLPYPDEEGTCLDAFLEVPQFHDQFESARSKVQDLWMSIARSALDKNASTVAVLPMETLFDDDGALNRFKSEGYEVQQPD